MAHTVSVRWVSLGLDLDATAGCDQVTIVPCTELGAAAPAISIVRSFLPMIYRIHILLGTIVAIPVLAWATSGLLYALPNRVEGGSVETISASRVRIPPDEAMRRANDFAGRQLPTTALTLLMRDGRPVYQAIGGMGADSLLIDAEDGAVRIAPPPGWMTRYFRQAHFYFFAGSWQVPLLVIMSFLAAMSAFSGIYLNIVYWLRPRRAARPSGPV